MSRTHITAAKPGTIVRRPRAGDAIGAALRSAYARDATPLLPADMIALLGKLDCKAVGKPH